MKIPIDRRLKIVLIKSLKQGYLDTNDIPELNDVRDNWFLELMKEASAVEAEEEKRRQEYDAARKRMK